MFIENAGLRENERLNEYSCFRAAFKFYCYYYLLCQRVTGFNFRRAMWDSGSSSSSRRRNEVVDCHFFWSDASDTGDIFGRATTTRASLVYALVWSRILERSFFFLETF